MKPVILSLQAKPIALSALFLQGSALGLQLSYYTEVSSLFAWLAKDAVSEYFHSTDYVCLIHSQVLA